MSTAKDVIKWVKFGGGTVSLDLEEANVLIDEIARLEESNTKLAAALENLLNSIGICDYQKQGVPVYDNAITALANAEKE